MCDNSTPAFLTITQSLYKSLSTPARVNNLTHSILAKASRCEFTPQWLAENTELISGENSATALLEKIKSKRAVSTGKKARVKNTDCFFAYLTGARLIIFYKINLSLYIKMVL